MEKPPTYLVGVASVWGKKEVRRAVIASGARFVDRSELLECLGDAVRFVVAADQRPELLDLLERARGVDVLKGERLDEDDQRRLLELTSIAHQHFPPYANLVALDGAWWPSMKYMAARYMLRGWVNVDVPFETRGGLVTDECLNRLDERHLDEIGIEAVRLMSISEEQKKSYSSPSRSPAAPQPSPSAATRQTDQSGSSSAIDTAPTPGT
jgi:hypothetical protein